MLIHPLAERLRAVGMAAMADAFLEIQNNIGRRRPRARGMARPVARSRSDGARQQAPRPATEPGPVASERSGRGYRLPRTARSGPRAVPQTRGL